MTSRVMKTRHYLMIMLALWLGTSFIIGGSAEAQSSAVKKKPKKKTTEESSDQYENSKYFSKGQDTGGPYRFNAEGQPIYSEPQAPKKKNKKRKKLRTKKQKNSPDTNSNPVVTPP